MKRLVAGILTLMLSFGATADSHEKWYLGLGGAVVNFDDGVDSVTPLNAYLRLGWDFSRYVGIGIEGGTSLIKDDFAGVNFAVNTGLVYVRGIVPVGNKSKIYALVGPARVELKGTQGNSVARVDDDDTAWGIGFETALESYSFNINYIKYYDNLGVDVGAINFGLVGYF